ncbi:MAG: hypothetical protein QNJ51_14165 [Calothrix sp. MO_167.B12]|nr:hypothetical protein [Calothrix sp. MO_167.B12]
MARYTCSFTLSIPFEHLQQLLIELLQDCGLDVVYYTSDYVMAREVLGQVTFSKLAIAELLIDKSTATETETRMTMVVKNEELPLQIDNHCRQIFMYIKQAIENCRHWHLIESFAS